MGGVKASASPEWGGVAVRITPQRLERRRKRPGVEVFTRVANAAPDRHCVLPSLRRAVQNSHSVEVSKACES